MKIKTLPLGALLFRTATAITIMISVNYSTHPNPAQAEEAAQIDKSCEAICDEMEEKLGSKVESTSEVESSKNESKQPTYSQQIISKCHAYKAAKLALLLDGIMMGLDGLAFSTCMTACFVPGAAPACDLIGIAEGAADMAVGIVQSSAEASSWMNVGLGAVGLGMGAHGLLRYF